MSPEHPFPKVQSSRVHDHFALFVWVMVVGALVIELLLLAGFN